MLNVLNKINEPKDLKQLQIKELEELAKEIREVLLKKNKYSWRTFWTKFWYDRSNNSTTLRI